MISHMKNYHPSEYSSMNRQKLASASLKTSTSITHISSATSSGNREDSNSIVGNEDIDCPPAVPPPPKKQKTMLEFTPLASASEKDCTAAVAKFISLAMQPYSIVESKPFVDMVKALNPKYKLPGRNFFSKNAIPKLYNTTKEKLQTLLTSVDEKGICITTDCWTSSNSVPYIGITAHFIKDWELVSLCLACVHFEEDHTSDNIREVLEEKLSEWSINVNNLLACTTDNGANILKAINSFSPLQHIPCFGHTINIGINRAMKMVSIRNALAKLKRLQNSISHSWKLSRDLTKAQKLLDMQLMKLPSACPTRWGSTLKLCKRFLANQLPISKVLRDHPSKQHLELERKEVLALETFVESTEFLEEITKNLSGENYTTASSVIPMLKKLKKTLDIKGNETPLLREVKKEILSALNERYFDNSELVDFLTTCTVCDPRFRLAYTLNKDAAEQNILSLMTEVYLLDHVPTSTADHEPVAKHGLEKLVDLDSDEEESGEDISHPTKKAEVELKNFISMPKISINENPLIWWKAHAPSFPSLRVLAEKYLAVQGTSVPSERVFSTGGNIITKNRTSLLPKNAETLVFLSQNKSFV